MTDESAGPSDDEATDGAVRGNYDWDVTAPSTAVVETLAVALNRTEASIDPLYDSIDPETLDAVVQSSRSTANTNTNTTTMAFTVGDRQVTVDSRGTVVVRPSVSETDRE
jgi:hypothetical protein